MIRSRHWLRRRVSATIDTERWGLGVAYFAAAFGNPPEVQVWVGPVVMRATSRHALDAFGLEEL